MVNSRRKGHDNERKLAVKYRCISIGAKRGIQTRGGGKESPDIILDEDKQWHIEAKCGAQIPKKIIDWFQKADADAGDKPVVMHLKPDRRRPVVMIDEELWWALVRAAHGQEAICSK